MLPTDSLFLLMFTSGLLGGFGHCVGMCGPIVATYSLGLEGRAIAPHLLYNLGRIVTYSVLGGVVGMTGSFVGVVGPIERFQNIALCLVGIAMIIMALSLGGWMPLPRGRGQGAEGRGNNDPITCFINRVVKYISGARTVGAYFPMGLILGFVPCGLLYTALIAAAGAGVGARNQAEGFLHGMLLLLLFGIGTSPALFLFGKIVSMKSEWLRGKLYRASALTMIVMGILFVYRAIR